MLTVTYEWQCDRCPAREIERYPFVHIKPKVQVHPVSTRPGGWSVVAGPIHTLVLCPAHRVEVV